jgi:hypothetical protein
MEQTVTVSITPNPHNRGAILEIQVDKSLGSVGNRQLTKTTLSRREFAALERIAANTGENPCDIAAQLICAYPFTAN